MKRLIILIIIFCASVAAQINGFKNFEIVECVPIETPFDNSNIRNAYEVWIELLKHAKQKLDIEQFYISNEKGEPLDDVINEIVSAGKRGVKVRVIADAIMYKTYPQTLDILKTQENIEVRLIDYRRIAGGVQHAKYFIVDDEIVFVGSQNFDWRSLKHIFELGFKIKSQELAGIFKDIFEIDWNLSGKGIAEIPKREYRVPLKIIDGSDTIKCIPTFSPYKFIPDESLSDEKQILNLIDNAKEEIYFHVLTYSPVSGNKDEYYSTLDNALRRAAIRGVKVHVMTSDWSKRKPTIYYLKSLSVIPNINVKMTTIPEYSGGFIPFARVDHRKILIVDKNFVWLGTSNWEKSYFYKGRNLGIVVENEKVNKILKEIFLKSWNGPYSYEIKPEIDYQPPRIGND